MAASDIDLPTFATLRARCEKSAAERDAAVGLVRLLLSFVETVGGYMTHDEQEVVRDARAFLAEHGGG